MPRLGSRVCLALTVLGTCFAPAAKAIDCGTTVFSIITHTDTEGVADVCGIRMTATLDGGITFSDQSTINSASGKINGIPVSVSTSAPNFNAITSSDTVTLVINGVTEYSGTLGALENNLDEVVRLFNLLNAGNSRIVTQFETNQVISTHLVDVIGRRLSRIVRARSLGATLREKSLGFLQRETGRMDRTLEAFRFHSDERPGSREKNSFDTGIVGRSAGDPADEGSSQWHSLSHTWLDNSGLLSAYSGTVTNWVTGIDQQYGDNVVVGLAGGIEWQDLDTDFNDGELTSIGLSILPYASISFMEGLVSVDAIAGYTRLQSFSSRNKSISEVEGDFGINRAMAAVNGNVYTRYGNFSFTGRAGMLYSMENTESFEEDNGSKIPTMTTHLLQGSVSGEISYVAETIEPYVRVTYVNDIYQGSIGSINSDDDEIQGELGILVYREKSGFYGDFNIGSTFSRQDRRTFTLLGTLIYSF